jgi:hypothetical protein
MIKTQVQIPDHLYREAKRIADEYELSFAEVVRRGLERLIPAFPRRDGAGAWSLPVLDLGLKGDPFADPDWREKANLPARAHARTGGARRQRHRS